jgi:hypothetical protein
MSSSFEGPPISAAVEYAKTLHSGLLKEVDNDSQKRIAQIISEGIQNKTGLPKTSRLIRNEFTITRQLAYTLVLTETNWALSHAMYDKMQNMGIDGKEWIGRGDACEICRANIKIRVIPAKQLFPSGHLCPPAHDGCTCALVPARLNRRHE